MATSAPIGSGVVRDEQPVWLHTGQREIYKFISARQGCALPGPAEMCFQDGGYWKKKQTELVSGKQRRK